MAKKCNILQKVRLKSVNEFDGAHVLKVDSVDKKKYIYPLCQTWSRGHDKTPVEAIELFLLDILPKKTKA